MARRGEVFQPATLGGVPGDGLNAREQFFSRSGMANP